MSEAVGNCAGLDLPPSLAKKVCSVKYVHLVVFLLIHTKKHPLQEVLAEVQLKSLNYSLIHGLQQYCGVGRQEFQLYGFQTMHNSMSRAVVNEENNLFVSENCGILTMNPLAEDYLQHSCFRVWFKQNGEGCNVLETRTLSLANRLMLELVTPDHVSTNENTRVFPC